VLLCNESAIYRVELGPKTAHKTGFIARKELFQFDVLNFRLRVIVLQLLLSYFLWSCLVFDGKFASILLMIW
jgi:hypothetical protein